MRKHFIILLNTQKTHLHITEKTAPRELMYSHGIQFNFFGLEMGSKDINVIFTLQFSETLENSHNFFSQFFLEKLTKYCRGVPPFLNVDQRVQIVFL